MSTYSGPATLGYIPSRDTHTVSKANGSYRYPPFMNEKTEAQRGPSDSKVTGTCQACTETQHTA